MQNKGFVKFIAVLLTLVCLFYMSFSFVAGPYNSKIEKLAQTDQQKARELEDSLMETKVYLGIWTLQECRSMGLGLGLDLKGGMSAVLEVSVPDVVMALSGHKELTNPKFKEAVEKATAATKESGNFIDAFAKAYDGKLSEIFATDQLRDRVGIDSDDDEVISVLKDEAESAIENSYNVIRSRVDRFGVAQPNIQKLKDDRGRIMVELPGVKEADVERVSKLLEGSANLEFWETWEGNEVVNDLVALDAALASNQIVEEETKAEEAEVAEAAEEAEEAEATEETAKETDLAAAAGLTAETTATTANAASDEETSLKRNPLLTKLSLYPQNNTSCVVGVAKKSDINYIDSLLNTKEAKQTLRSDLKLRWGVKGRGKGTEANIYELYALKVTTSDKRAPLEGDVITTANDEFRDGRPVVSMAMTSNGARKWANLTEKNVGHSIAIVLDDRVYSAPNVNNKIEGGRSEISGNFTVQDTRDLANVLKSGKMPAPAKIISREVVGPSLGAEAIQMGVYSCILAFIILMLYMVAMYGLIPGMVANCALILNLFFTIGILTSFQAALTMSGIAGLVLTLGMAVDANVLIYERTKEELKAGKRVPDAVQAGYSNAFSAIFDSNLTSIITAIILFNFGKGPIRGFATTLGIGIVVSFFTAVFLTRVLYTEMHARGKWQNLKFKTKVGNRLSFKNPSFRFMQNYKKSFAVFGVLVAASLTLVFTRGFSQSVDFTGGRTYNVEFQENVKLDQVRQTLNNIIPAGNSVSAIAIGTSGKTIRISTNYLIDNETTDADSEVEKLITTNLEGSKIISSQKVGPSMAEDIKHGAVMAVAFAFVAIFLYILLRFRNVAFSIGAIVALFVDIVVILGMYAALWGIVPFSLDIDQTFIGALLTAIGYSINDKVVVFDRIRENIGLYPKRDRQRLLNESLNTTLNRTINTSVSTFIVLAVIFVIGLFFKGADSIISFSFAMILGVVFGTFSSMFVAAPVAYLVQGRKIKEAAAEETAVEKK